MTFNPFDRGDFWWHSSTSGTSPDRSSAVILPCGRWYYLHRGEAKPCAGGASGGQEAVMEARAKRLRAEGR
jgi:hypothetical protein